VDLIIRDLPARKNQMGTQTIETLIAGKHFKVETSPGGDGLLDYEVPEGKVARITTTVIIDESDA